MVRLELLAKFHISHQAFLSQSGFARFLVTDDGLACLLDRLIHKSARSIEYNGHQIKYAEAVDHVRTSHTLPWVWDTTNREASREAMLGLKCKVQDTRGKKKKEKESERIQPCQDDLYQNV